MAQPKLTFDEGPCWLLLPLHQLALAGITGITGCVPCSELEGHLCAD